MSSNIKQYNVYFQLDFKRDICLRRLSARLEEIWRNSCSTVAAGYRNHLSLRLVKKKKKEREFRRGWNLFCPGFTSKA